MIPFIEIICQPQSYNLLLRLFNKDYFMSRGDDEKLSTAWHEAGHAIIQALYLYQINLILDGTIMPRERFVGLVSYLTLSKSYDGKVAEVISALEHMNLLEMKLIKSFAGGVAEQLHKLSEAQIFLREDDFDEFLDMHGLDDDLEETYLNSFCKGYRVTNKKANPYFLNYLLLSDNYKKLITVEGKGFTRINLKMEKINDFIV